MYFVNKARSNTAGVDGHISTRHAGWKHPPQIASGGSSGAAPSMSELPQVTGASVTFVFVALSSAVDAQIGE
jgi:hypothetical protein